MDTTGSSRRKKRKPVHCPSANHSYNLPAPSALPRTSVISSQTFEPPSSVDKDDDYSLDENGNIVVKSTIEHEGEEESNKSETITSNTNNTIELEQPIKSMTTQATIELSSHSESGDDLIIDETGLVIENTPHTLNSTENSTILEQMSKLSSKNLSPMEDMEDVDDTNNSRYSCDYCHFQASTPTRLRTHMQVHNSKQSFRCGLCFRGYKRSSDLNRHMKTVHGMRLREYLEATTQNNNATKNVSPNDKQEQHLKKRSDDIGEQEAMAENVDPTAAITSSELHNLWYQNMNNPYLTAFGSPDKATTFLQNISLLSQIQQQQENIISTDNSSATTDFQKYLHNLTGKEIALSDEQLELQTSNIGKVTNETIMDDEKSIGSHVELDRNATASTDQSSFSLLHASADSNNIEAPLDLSAKPSSCENLELQIGDSVEKIPSGVDPDFLSPIQLVSTNSTTSEEIYSSTSENANSSSAVFPVTNDTVVVSCPFCEKNFKGKSNLVGHLRRTHKISPNKMSRIDPQLGKISSSSSMSLLTPTDETSSQMKSETTVTSSSTKRKNSGRGGKSSSCPHCPYKPVSRLDLHTHSRTHLQVKPFRCLFCDYASRWRCDCKNHMKKHHCEKWHGDLMVLNECMRNVNRNARQIMATYRQEMAKNMSSTPQKNTSKTSPNERVNDSFQSFESNPDEVTSSAEKKDTAAEFSSENEEQRERNHSFVSNDSHISSSFLNSPPSTAGYGKDVYKGSSGRAFSFGEITTTGDKFSGQQMEQQSVTLREESEIIEAKNCSVFPSPVSVEKNKQAPSTAEVTSSNNNNQLQDSSEIHMESMMAEAVAARKRRTFAQSMKITEIPPKSPDGNHRCLRCRFKTKLTKKMEEHLASHNDYKMYKCGTCGKRANWKWDIRKHIELKHQSQGFIEKMSLEEAKRTLETYLNSDEHIIRYSKNNPHRAYSSMVTTSSTTARTNNETLPLFPGKVSFNGDTNETHSQPSVIPEPLMEVAITSAEAANQQNTMHQQEPPSIISTASTFSNQQKVIHPKKEQLYGSSIYPVSCVDDVAEQMTSFPSSSNKETAFSTDFGSSCLSVSMPLIDTGNTSDVITTDGNDEKEITKVSTSSRRPYSSNFKRKGEDRRPYKCSACGRRSNWRWDIKKHGRYMHPGQQITVIDIQSGEDAYKMRHRTILPNNSQKSMNSSSSPVASAEGCQFSLPIFEGHRYDSPMKGAIHDSSKNIVNLRNRTNYEKNNSKSVLESSTIKLNGRRNNTNYLAKLRSQLKIKLHQCPYCPYRSNWYSDVFRHMGVQHHRRGQVIILNEHQARSTLADYEKWHRLERRKFRRGGCDGSGYNTGQQQQRELLSSNGRRIKNNGSGISPNSSADNVKATATVALDYALTSKPIFPAEISHFSLSQINPANNNKEEMSNMFSRSAATTIPSSGVTMTTTTKTVPVWCCRNCDFLHRNQHVTKLHCLTHRRMKFSCSICQYSSNHRSSVYRHGTNSHPDHFVFGSSAKYIIENIDEEMNRDGGEDDKSILSEEMVIDITPYQIEITSEELQRRSCQLSMKSSGANRMKKVIMSNDEMQQEIKYRCKICPFLSTTRETTLRHIRMTHRISNAAFYITGVKNSGNLANKRNCSSSSKSAEKILFHSSTGSPMIASRSPFKKKLRLCLSSTKKKRGGSFFDKTSFSNPTTTASCSKCKFTTQFGEIALNRHLTMYHSRRDGDASVNGNPQMSRAQHVVLKNHGNIDKEEGETSNSIIDTVIRAEQQQGEDEICSNSDEGDIDTCSEPPHNVVRALNFSSSTKMSKNNSLHVTKDNTEMGLLEDREFITRSNNDYNNYNRPQRPSSVDLKPVNKASELNPDIIKLMMSEIEARNTELATTQKIVTANREGDRFRNHPSIVESKKSSSRANSPASPNVSSISPPSYCKMTTKVTSTTSANPTFSSTGYSGGNPASRKYRCNICPYKCGFSKHLQRHQALHENNEAYKCRFCSYSVSKAHLVLQHEALHMADGVKPTFNEHLGIDVPPSGTTLQHHNIITDKRDGRIDYGDGEIIDGAAVDANNNEKINKDAAARMSSSSIPSVATARKTSTTSSTYSHPRDHDSTTDDSETIVTRTKKLLKNWLPSEIAQYHHQQQQNNMMMTAASSSPAISNNNRSSHSNNSHHIIDIMTTPNKNQQQKLINSFQITMSPSVTTDNDHENHNSNDISVRSASQHQATMQQLLQQQRLNNNNTNSLFNPALLLFPQLLAMTSLENNTSGGSTKTTSGSTTNPLLLGAVAFQQQQEQYQKSLEAAALATASNPLNSLLIAQLLAAAAATTTGGYPNNNSSSHQSSNNVQQLGKSSSSSSLAKTASAMFTQQQQQQPNLFPQELHQQSLSSQKNDARSSSIDTNNNTTSATAAAISASSGNHGNNNNNNDAATTTEIMLGRMMLTSGGFGGGQQTTDFFSTPLCNNNISTTTTLKCAKCPHVAKSSTSLQSHVKYHGGTESRRYRFPCAFCDFSVPDADWLAEHMELHTRGDGGVFLSSATL